MTAERPPQIDGALRISKAAHADCSGCPVQEIIEYAEGLERQLAEARGREARGVAAAREFLHVVDGYEDTIGRKALEAWVDEADPSWNIKRLGINPDAARGATEGGAE